MGRVFREPFDQPRRGWMAYAVDGTDIPVEVANGAAVSRGPWWVDYNHAPPGGGYLHILFALHTRYQPGWAEAFDPRYGPDPLVTGKYPTDFRNARITCRLKGRLNARGASLVFLAQAKLKSSGKWVNQVLTGQPLQVTPEWTAQTIRLVPDQKQWTQLGSRHDRADTYAEGPIEELLADLNGDFIFVLYPLDVVPRQAIPGDRHVLRAGADYAVDRSHLPEGEVWMDDFGIEFVR